MTEVPSPQLRISDQTRESALTALGEHMTAGRIDIDEYGERSARITAAKTRGELGEIFGDLPSPHPSYDDTPQAAVAATAAEKQPAQQRPATPDGWTGPQRFIAAILPVLWIAAIALIATGVVSGVFILVPIGASVFARGMWGHGGGHHDHYDRRDRHLRDRERRRELRDSYRDRRRELGR
ncbi:DUF1707 domain-containing protein [Amycolatopsis sp., V23-08]|uniref:DUF1707 domain-containing protein n=1 Tax=Amycolatopsis heterodermiae TaxID=3110235 RepID=A0ABU5RJJ6_9PSEU|nr:DUF1707 domain-containing protein [Amycolatopsis sp., V23-08]MEA5365909.1 DUF1707 domain-containing protein [Amycolatopsis sp., V23-08]